MASGDTKTEAMLRILGNGGSADAYRGCCNTKTQSYILDAIDRIEDVEEEVEELKNNPDVADIVDTYADLQDYDTKQLTDKAIIRVLEDEEHGGESTYYRYDKKNDSFTYIGVINSGKRIVLTEADYNWPVENPNGIAFWLLSDGDYYAPYGLGFYPDSNIRDTFGHYFSVWESSVAYYKMAFDVDNGNKIYLRSNSIYGSNQPNYPIRVLTSLDLSQESGTSQSDVMSQKAVTDFINGKIISNSGAPTTSTVGTVGQLLVDNTNGKLYICTDATNPYVWEEVGAGGSYDPTISNNTLYL